MKRILVIGCPGAGKSTFARALRDRTGLPLWYLDQIWHRPDRTTVSRAEFDARLTGLLRGVAWIIDGNYLRTLEFWLRAADTVFLLDYPTGVCLEGTRLHRYKAGGPALGEGGVRSRVLPVDRGFQPGSAPGDPPPAGAVWRRREMYVFHSRTEADDWLRAFPGV